MSHPQATRVDELRAQADASTLLRMEGIGKSFAGVQVLSGVRFDLKKGEVHVIAGENGAGKSTLIKILSGVYDDYDGTIQLDGATQRFTSPHDALRCGIAVIYQEMSLVGGMTVVDNLLLAKEVTKGRFWVDQTEQIGRAERAMGQIGVEIDVGRRVEEYPIAVRQTIEIAKAVAARARILVMDEPTSSLNDLEAERLFTIIRGLQAKGCGIIYISHKMEEIDRLADRITVLRDGTYVGTFPGGELSRAELIRKMVGREVSQYYPPRPVCSGAERLRVANCSLPMSASNSQIEIKEVSFYVRAGEILGIAGLQGSGSSELLNALFGAYGPLKAGTVMMDGHLVDIPSPRTAIRLGMALLTNDRMGTGLVMEMDVVSNVTLAAVRRLSSHGWLKRQAELQTTKRQSARLRLKALSLRQRVATLSGGNQQKVVFAKWLETSPRVFLLDDPTRGVDIGVKHDIYELMNDLTRSGCGILLVSSELPELLAMSDRILVMHRGRACKEYPRDEATQELILQAALGH